MTDTEFTAISRELQGDIKESTPRKTGNLRGNATLIRKIGSNEIRIYVDTEIAPYFDLVNYRKTYKVKSRFRDAMLTKQNKNYHYFENAVEAAINNLARKIGGEIVKK